MYMSQTGDLISVDVEDGPAFKTAGPPPPLTLLLNWMPQLEQ